MSGRSRAGRWEGRVDKSSGNKPGAPHCLFTQFLGTAAGVGVCASRGCRHVGGASCWPHMVAPPTSIPSSNSHRPPCIDEAQRGTVSHSSQGSQLARGRGGVSSGLRCPGLCPRPPGSDAQPSGSWAGVPGRRVTSPSHPASLGLRPQVQRLHQGLPQRAAGRRWLPEDLQAVLPVWGPHQVRHICF